MVPQVAQGALAVECRADDDRAIGLLGAIDDRRSHRCVDAERGFLARLGGGCDLPVGALAVQDDAAGITVDALLASADGRVVLRAQRAGGWADDPTTLGAELAEYLLHQAGGDDLLGDRLGAVR